jgi:cell division protein FtsB
MKQWGRIALFATSFVVGFALLLQTFLQPQSWRQRSLLAADLVTLQSANGAMQERINGLRADIDALNHSPRAQEHVIRDELGWVRPGELIINFGDNP